MVRSLDDRTFQLSLGLPQLLRVLLHEVQLLLEDRHANRADALRIPFRRRRHEVQVLLGRVHPRAPLRKTALLAKIGVDSVEN